MKIVKPILALLLISFFFACETEETLEEQGSIDNIVIQNKANIKSNRTRLKQRPNGLYKTVIVLPENGENNDLVDSIEVQIAPNGEITPQPESITLQKVVTENGTVKYVHNQLNFEGGNPIGVVFNTTTTYYDSNGTMVNQPISISLRANANIKKSRTRIKRRNNGLYKVTTTLPENGNTQNAEVAFVEVQIEPNGDIAPTEGVINLDQQETQNGKIKFTYNELSFEGNPLGKNFNTTVTYLDQNGNFLADDIFNIQAKGIKSSRTRLKKRPNGLYKTIIILPEDGTNTNNDVASVQLELQAYGDVVPEPAIINLERKVTANGTVKFVHKTLDFSSNPDGLPFDAILKKLDEQGNQIGEENIISITAENKDLFFDSIKAFQNENGETFTFKTAIKGALRNEVASLVLQLTPLDGGSDLEEGEEVTIPFLRERNKAKIFKNKSITFVDVDNVIDMEYSFVLIALNEAGEEIYRAEYRRIEWEHTVAG